MLVASQVAPGKPEILHHLDISDDDRRQRHGVGEHTSISEIEVSQSTSVTFRFTVGSEPVVDGGQLLVVWRWPFDWSDLQDSDLSAAGFMSVKIVGADDRDISQLEFHLRYNWIAGIEPWHHQVQVTVANGGLQQGDRIELTCGDSSHGGSGWRAPTCIAERCRFLMLIDNLGNGVRNRLVQTPSFRVTAGPAVRIAATVESDSVVNQPALLTVRAEDCWGNPTTLSDQPAVAPNSAESFSANIVQRAEPSASGNSPADELVSANAHHPAYHYEITATAAGTSAFRVESGSMTTTSNTLIVHEESPARSLFWGDLHSGQTEIGCGCGSLAEHYAFGRDCSGLQFMTHQANDHYCTLDDWNHTREVTEAFHEPGRYVPILGCEWSPMTKDGGDRNVFYRDDDPKLRRSDRFFRESDPDPEPDVRTAPEFHEAFHDLDVLVNIHVGGRMTNLQWYDQQIERLCETHSTHGTVEWFFMDALERGYKVGLTAGTDGVMGRPGACHPGRRLIRNLKNGLTAVYAKELTREAIWDALQNRCCYATTGERIRLWFEVNGAPMGSELQADGDLEVAFSVQGTQPIERIDLFEGTTIVKTWNVAPPVSNQGASSRLRILWGGTERKGTARLQKVNWCGDAKLIGGEIELIDRINFQSIDDIATCTSSDRIEWSNYSAGNAAGVVVRVTNPESARLQIETEPFMGEFSVADVLSNPAHVEAGGLSRFLSIGPPPDPNGTTEFEETHAMTRQTTGERPVWIRVTQIDQSLAWSSPVYVREPDGAS
jgi:hypothetical protein